MPSVSLSSADECLSQPGDPRPAGRSQPRRRAGNSPIISLNYRWRSGGITDLHLIRRWGPFEATQTQAYSLISPFPIAEWFRLIIEDRHSRSATMEKGCRIWVQRAVEKGHVAPVLIHSDDYPTMHEPPRPPNSGLRGALVEAHEALAVVRFLRFWSGWTIRRFRSKKILPFGR